MKTNKYSLLKYQMLFVSAAFLSVAFPALAVDPASTITPTPDTETETTVTPKPTGWRETKSNIKAERQESREEDKEDKKNLQEDRQEARSTIKQERQTIWTEIKKKQVEFVASRIQKELELRYSVILKLKAKIADRITKKSADFDTSAASAKLALFSDAQYQKDLTDFKGKIAALTTSPTPRDLLPGIRQSADTVRKDLRAMHQFLVEVMKLVATAPKR